ncbi:MAG: TetR/AcrR family transcriptional regulator [Actinomycetota bacterium]|nr:TetR/AcrR family transcriptional regulator [Actinomycetota bacterium]
MSTPTDPEPQRDPRAVRTRRAVLDAAAVLLAEVGSAGVTHQRVAERAGVGRATVYRHWPTAAELLYDVLAEADEPLFRAGPGGLVPWLRCELRRLAVDVGTPNAVQFLAVLMSRVHLDPAAASLRDRMVARSVAPLAAGFQRAIAAGELAAAPNIDDAFAALVGPVLFRVVFEGRDASDVFIEALIDQVLAPWRSR